MDGFSKNLVNLILWWLRFDTATYDKEMPKGLYTGHQLEQSKQSKVDKDLGIAMLKYLSLTLRF